MAQRLYMILLEDDPEEPGFELFEEMAKDFLSDTWDNCAYSAMDHVNVTVAAEDANEDCPEGSDRDDADTMGEMADTLEILQGKIQRSKSGE